MSEPVFGGDAVRVQLLPFVLTSIIAFIPSWKLCRKLEMSPAWAFYAFIPWAGLIVILYRAAFGRIAGYIILALVALNVIVAIVAAILPAHGETASPYVKNSERRSRGVARLLVSTWQRRADHEPVDGQRGEGVHGTQVLGGLQYQTAMDDGKGATRPDHYRGIHPHPRRCPVPRRSRW
jgi:hypothetical protein